MTTPSNKRRALILAAIAQRIVADAYNKQEDATRHHLQAYEDAFDDVVRETSAVYAKHGKDGVLTQSELTKYGRLDKLLIAYAATIERLGKSEQRFMDESMRNMYETTYRKTYGAFRWGIDPADPGAQQGAYKSIGRTLTERKIEAVLRHPWSGEDYSGRIWHNKDEMMRNLRQTLIGGAVRGESITDITHDMQRRIESSATNARRLIRTESMHFANQGQVGGFRAVGYRHVEVMVAIDERTCPDCVGHEGERYTVEEAGNVLPLHPNCRCTWNPVESTRNMDEAAAYYERQLLVKYGYEDTTEQTELFHKTGEKYERTPATRKEQHQLTKEFRRKGGIVDESEEGNARLIALKANASYINSYEGEPPVITLAEGVTRAEIAEEVIHWKQDVNNRFGDCDDPIEISLRREIEAKKEVLRRKEVYNMTEGEVRHFEEQIENYEQKLKEHLSGY